MVIGVISDTHGLLRPQAVRALRGVEHIIHAGDVGGSDILANLRKVAPVTAIVGNVDVEAWAKKLPAIEVVELGGLSFYVLHNLRAIDLNPKAAGFAAVISGHSHKPGYEFSDGVLYFNPGSAGPRRFKLPVTVGKIEIRDGELFPEIIELAI
jgi:putative phosphoesterase